MTQDVMLAYALVGAAVAAAVMLFFRQRVSEGVDERGARWEHLPRIYKIVWGFVMAYEGTLGETLASALPRGTGRLRALIPPSALPLTAARVRAASALLGFVLAGVIFLALIPVYGSMRPLAAWATGGAGILVGFAIGWIWPIQNLKVAAERRQRELSRQLPFAIDLMASALRAGLEFSASMRYYVGLGVGGALTEEFARTLGDVSLGRPLPEALQEMAGRTRLEHFSAFAEAVAYGAEVGAPVSDALKVHASEMRRVRFAQAERKAARAPIIMIVPLAVFIMPSVFVVILTPLVMQLKTFH